MHLKSLSFFAIIIVIFYTGTSCHKTSTQAPAAKYRVKHIVDSANYYTDTIYEGLVVSDYQVTYANNRIASIISNVSNPSHLTNIPQSDTATFFFYFTTYAIHHSSFPFYTDSVFFNSLHEITGSTGGINTAFFQYNSNLQVTLYQINGLTTGSFGTNTWDANGNISTVTSTDTAMVYYYQDRQCVVGDYSEINNFLTFGNMIITTKNLTKSIISPRRNINVNYSFDNNGNITNTRSNAQITNLYSGTQAITTHSYTFEYDTY